MTQVKRIKLVGNKVEDKATPQKLYIQHREGINALLKEVKSMNEEVKTDKQAAEVIAQVLKTKYKAQIKL